MSSTNSPGFELAVPTGVAFRDALRTITGKDFHDTWRRLCSDAGVPREPEVMDLVHLERLAAIAQATPGVVGVIGRSLNVRISSYRTLMALSGDKS